MFDKQKVTEILKSFYTLTGVKVVIFDTGFKEVLSYPDSHCAFCAAVNEVYGNRCRKSEYEFCKRAQSLMNMYIGRCHANLLEAVFPIIDSGLVAGYLMFGQILPEGDEKTSFPEFERHCNSILRKSADEIDACTDVLKGIAHYIMTMHPADGFDKSGELAIVRYIEKNLEQDLSIDALCKQFSCSRTKLYGMVRPHMPSGIAAYIKSARLKKAKDYLEKTSFSVRSISSKVGYADYNYFCRDFKKTFGISAADYRVYYKNKKN